MIDMMCLNTFCFWKARGPGLWTRLVEQACGFMDETSLYNSLLITVFSYLSKTIFLLKHESTKIYEINKNVQIYENTPNYIKMYMIFLITHDYL